MSGIRSVIGKTVGPFIGVLVIQDKVAIIMLDSSYCDLQRYGVQYRMYRC